MRKRLILVALVVSLTSVVAPALAVVDHKRHFEPKLLSRILHANAYAATRPGFAGIVVRDRKTGAVWRNRHSDTLIWACSTPKLAMVVDLLLRDDAGAISLTAEDRHLMHLMLNTSDNDAAHTLWRRYGGEDFATRFPSYGMTDMRFTDEHPHHWGWILTTANDLDRLMNFILAKMPAAHRDYIVNEMRTVDPNQQWGVWGAGAAAQPGNKNGWSDDNDDGSWLTNSVGFVGPDARYTLSIMNNTQVVDNGFDVGRKTTTEISRIMFNGYFG
ncbi:class A beta-lactamase-related serine hydrolase [Kibdelosporangium philippinense]|uniref:Class A beta-lactamase-related serine hydrolase n=1 Tax=Kibdelosporangium philippinense TaxID=211113 RepID=A0ABS8ZDT3_9PSEU|nr:serine hydrolase [Kibdelosporangium philippinense]MCE7006004.1 class A beta-lactamase-related serine hydrolase [Kibdelosporangium philippinense]